MKAPSKKEAVERIAKLRDQINEYRYEYHVKNRSIMSEAAADSLKHELTQLETAHPELITPDSPSQRVAGEPLPTFKAVRHQTRMLSLNDVFDEGELTAWLERIRKLLPEGYKPEFHIDLKMDGLACSLVYEGGQLARGVTRGDGQVGEDVTSNVKTIESVPLTLRRDSKVPVALYKDRVEIRGEIVMYKKDFEELNEARRKAGKPLYMNPRNTAAGTVRQLDPKLVAERHLKFHAYSVIHDQIQDHAQEYELADRLGFIVNPQNKVVRSIKDIMVFVHEWEEKRHELPFNTDGLVIRINNRKAFDELGVVGKAPRGAVAFKYPAEQATTKVKDIFVSIGRTGAATPVAVLEPVVVAGSTVQMATLHNEKEVARKDIRIGDTVIIHKAGDVIPEVIESLPKLRTGEEKVFKMPSHCPECNTKLEKTDKEAVWRCPNPQCPARVHNQIEHYASKSALDIEGLGEKVVLALLDAGLINDVADLYKLTKYDLLKLDRFADVSAQKLVTAIQAKKQPPLPRFIYGLGIRHVGQQTAVDLAEYFGALDKLEKATVEELMEVIGVGEVVAESVVVWFSKKSHQELLDKLAKHGVKPVMPRTSSKLEGKSFVVTGTLDSMEREEAAERIRALGGKFQTSVAKGTDYVVVGENPGQNKIEKAKGLGTKLIDEEQFLRLIKQ